MHEYIVAWDIAKRHDRLASMVFQRTPEHVHDPDGKSRGIEYLDALLIAQYSGLPYPEIGQKIVDLQQHKNLRGNSDLLIDQTGVGEAAVDIVRAKGLNPWGVMISSGNKPVPKYAPRAEVFKGSAPLGGDILVGWSVPRQDLVTAGQVIIQQKRLRIDPRMPGAPQFKEQLEAFKQNKTTKKYEAEEDAIHDDLVFCYLMAAWWILQTKANESQFDVPAAPTARRGRPETRFDQVEDFDPTAL